MSMAGQSPQVLATLTQDLGKVLSALQKNHIGGAVDLPTALNVAQLALKHRENKNQRQRIVVFIGSPVTSSSSSSSSSGGVTEESLVKLGKKLKKNNVAVDVVLFGDEGIANQDLLTKFVDSVQNSDNSNLVIIPPGPHLMSDILASSTVLAGESATAGGVGGDGDAMMTDTAGAGGSGGADDFGVDPNMDPELAMVLRLSMQEEEERQRRAAEGGSSAPTTTAADPATNNNPEAAAAAPPAAQQQANPESVEPSRSETTQPPPHPAFEAPPSNSGPISTSNTLASPPAEPKNDDVSMGDEDEDDEQAMLKAIAMSLEGSGQNKDEDKK